MSDLALSVWGEVVLGDYAHIKARIGWRGLSSSEYTDSGPYLIAGTHIKGELIDWESCHHINKFRYDESPEIQLKEQDVIISKDGTIGRLGFVENMPGPATINGTMMLIRPDDNFYSKFIYYYLQGNKFQKVVKEKVSGSSVPHIFQRDMVTLTVPFPPFLEQQKIAAIFTSIDEVIEKTQAQIDKLKDLKTGMMQQLLTSGVGVDGKPHSEFKDSAVGSVPKEWDVVTLGDVTVESAFGPRFSSNEYALDGNIGCIRTTDMDENWDINYSTAPLARLDFNEFEKHLLVDGDLLVTRSGTCGLVDVFREQSIPMVAAAFLIRFRLDETVAPSFVRYLMMSTDTQANVQLLASGGVQKNLSGTSLKTLKIIRPSIEEQNKIVTIIESINKRISLANSKQYSNKKLKKSLMQDLLTGKVRVTVPESSTGH